VLGVGFGIAVTVGNTVGAGILRTPGEIAAQLPSPWLFLAVWVAGGIYALLGSNAIAELGAMTPLSGGQYVFSRRAFGPFPGFIVGWSDWVSTCGTVGAVALVASEYTGILIPALAPYEKRLAASAILTFAMLNWAGVRWGDRTQQITSLLKAAAYLAVVAACFALAGRAVSPTESTATAVAPLRLTGVLLAVQAVIYTYDGWTGPIYFSEEVRHPGRDIPRALIGGALCVTVLYLLVNIAILVVLPYSAIAGESLALATAARAIFGPRGDTIVRALIVVGMLSAINALLLMAPRVLYAVSRDGLGWRGATSVNEGGTPTVALLLSAGIAMLFLAETFAGAIAVLAFFFVANYVFSFTALFVLRRREPDTPRPYRAWGHPWTTAILLVVSLAFLVTAVRSDTRHSVYALLALGMSYPVYLLLNRRRAEE
jgi:APA family basic amino acid/polyamine antiporter